MSTDKKPYKHQDRSNHYHPDVLTNGWTKRSILLHFDDASYDALSKNYRFTISEPIPDVVFAEWITANQGLVGKLLSVKEFNNDGQTTQKLTTITPNNNPYVPPAPPAPIPLPPAFNASAPYAVGDKVSFSSKTYELTFNVAQSSLDPSQLNSGWVLNNTYFTQNPWSATKVLKKYEWVKGSDNFFYQLINPTTYPAVQPTPVGDTSGKWSAPTSPTAWSATDFYTTGTSLYAPSLCVFSGSFYVLTTLQAGITGEDPPTNGVYPNWNEYTPPTPNVDPEAQPFYPPALPNQSSESVKYWRLISDTNNYLSPSLADPLMNPVNLFDINLKLYNVNGTSYTPAGGAYLQIFVWSYCCKESR